MFKVSGFLKHSSYPTGASTKWAGCRNVRHNKYGPSFRGMVLFCLNERFVGVIRVRAITPGENQELLKELH